jgi:hypothetical protein
MARCFSTDAIQHVATEGLGSPVRRGDIVEDHRRAVVKLGVRFEIVHITQAEDLVTSLLMIHHKDGKRALSAAIARFGDDGLVSEVYSYTKPPTD